MSRIIERYRAEFIPQAWVRDNAIEVDAEGPTTWDVTDYIETLTGDEREMTLAGFSYEADLLRYHGDVPDWIRNWHGPFEIDVYLEEVTL